MEIWELALSLYILINLGFISILYLAVGFKSEEHTTLDTMMTYILIVFFGLPLFFIYLLFKMYLRWKKR